MSEKKKKLTLLVDEDLYEKFRAIADAQRLPMTGVMRQWILNAPDPRKEETNAQKTRRSGSSQDTQ